MMTSEREALLARVDAADAKRRLGRAERFRRHPFFSAGVSLGMRFLNQALGGRVRLRLRRRTALGDPMTVVVPSSAEDIWLYGAAVDSDAEARLTRYLIRSLGEGERFFDVGANLGWYSLLAARLVGPRGRVLAFEPGPHVLPLLESNVAGRPNIEIVRLALGDSAGPCDFHVAPDNLIGSSSLASEWVPGADRVRVESLPLDEYCARAGVVPTHVKIDVEGAEELVLAGARRVLRERAPTVAMEMWFEPEVPAHRRAASLLADLGYRPFAIEPDGSLCEPAGGLDGHFARQRERYRRIGDHGPDNVVFRRPGLARG